MAFRNTGIHTFCIFVRSKERWMRGGELEWGRGRGGFLLQWCKEEMATGKNQMMKDKREKSTQICLL